MTRNEARENMMKIMYEMDAQDPWTGRPQTDCVKRGFRAII